MSEQTKFSPWFKAPLAEAEARLRKVALRAKEPLSRVTWVWLLIQRAAQSLDRGGAFDLDRAELALLDRVEEETIDRIVIAFEAPDVALIVDGRCATFKTKELTADQRFKAKKAAEKAASLAAAEQAARDAESAKCVAPATREAASASRFATESLESRSVDLEERIERSPPSVVEVCRPREDATTTTDEEIFEAVRKIDPEKIPENVARAFVPIAKALIAEGVGFENVIVPELTGIAHYSARPRTTLTDRKTVDQIRNPLLRRGPPRAAPPVPDAAFFAEDFRPNSRFSAPPDYDAQLLEQMKAEGHA